MVTCDLLLLKKLAARTSGDRGVAYMILGLDGPRPPQLSSTLSRGPLLSSAVNLMPRIPFTASVTMASFSSRSAMSAFCATLYRCVTRVASGVISAKLIALANRARQPMRYSRKAVERSSLRAVLTSRQFSELKSATLGASMPKRLIVALDDSLVSAAIVTMYKIINAGRKQIELIHEKIVGGSPVSIYSSCLIISKVSCI
jgi:hypothetical protein